MGLVGAGEALTSIQMFAAAGCTRGPLTGPQGRASSEGLGWGGGDTGLGLVSPRDTRRSSGCWSSALSLCRSCSSQAPTGSAQQLFSSPGPLSHGERVTPHWLLGGRARRAVSLQEQMPAPARAEVAVTAEGKELVLVLERNQLLAPGYTETHYSEQGQPVTVTPNHTEHCHYHGHVRGHRGSWVVLSTCSGIRGLIVLSSNTSYYLRPLGTPEPGLHLIHRAEHLPLPGGTCGHGQPLGSTVAGIARLFQPQQPRARRDAWRTMKYMELFIVADHTLYRNQNLNLGHTKQRIVEIANYVDKFYRLLNIKVALIGLEVWTERDQCSVSSDANATLWAFLQWKKSLRARKKHDNAQLLTGKTFGGTTIGMAPLEGMCSADNSGGVSVDHAEQPIGAAATMAHEIGHNFGMVHDAQGCCVEATPEQGGCVMAAATGHPFPRVFSSCSRRQLENYFQKGGGMCLFNLPDTKDLVVARKCGNGFREEGEDCDCGEVEECTNPCCNAHNCTLKEGAQCAHGDCCHSCKLKVAGTLCREAAGSCDLPEYCTGASPYCPANVYLLDGSSCARGQAYCSTGMCMTHQQQCVQLWGPGAWPAPDACFQDVNMAGNTYGNCGKDSQGRYVKCDKRDAMCGKIQCQSSAKKPQGTNTVSIDTTIRFKGREVKCRGTFVYSAKDDQEDLSDPGLVLTGTKCGDGMVCKDRRCQNASLFELEKCVSRCHGHGVCNSNKNCHCDPGWAPPFCEKPGLGGSVDSGPVQSHNHESILIALVVIFLFLLPALALSIYYWYRQENSLLARWIKDTRHRGHQACRKKSMGRKSSSAHPKAAFTLRNISASSHPPEQGPRTAFLPKAGAAQPGSQPVNVVHPLRPAPLSIPPRPRDPRPARPPPPATKSPLVPTKAGASQAKLPPPKKPLPCSPVRSPQVVPKHQAPRRPLPGSPLLAKELPPAHGQTLLVMVPPSNFKVSGTSGSSHPTRPLKPMPPQRPVPAIKVQSTSFSSKK
ncbi:disintegrin and metalloproteinase domain-containing protein 33 [Onychostruthus taczanowskii]|uniref:disintegrin and metalloproteinase domain-containing protein 33 n=1 Tax=Onychostruthus taczanowskii TaxID=356909 RepID=UPI001B803D67|nr:disintegrin and metalloproteinase domain-containing protein 33 [Onychostruthus taczanowskii]